MYVQSPYFSSKQEIRYKLPSDKYESISNISPKSVKAGLVTYGPFTDIVAFTESEQEFSPLEFYKMTEEQTNRIQTRLKAAMENYDNHNK